MTLEIEVASLTSATNLLLTAVNVSKIALDQKVATATTQAALSAANAATATAQNSASGTSAVASALSAASSAAARDLSLAAWTSSMAPAETLPTVSKSFHYGTLVKAIIYDTSKDSDGGAWIKRCQDKSWFTEALGFTGAWRNQLASVTAAWATSGAAAGDGYQNTTDGKYYVLTGTSTQAEIFRGNVREFPARVGIVAEAARVVIYDLTQVGCPMFMVFRGDVAMVLLYGTIGVSSLAAANGTLAVGSNSSTTGLYTISFVTGEILRWGTSVFGFNGAISQRNSPLDYTQQSRPSIVSPTVNDIAITVLDNAPVDPATGLPVPTVVAFTEGGASVIADDGVVYTKTFGAASTKTGFFTTDGRLWIDFASGANGDFWGSTKNIKATETAAQFIASPNYRNLGASTEIGISGYPHRTGAPTGTSFALGGPGVNRINGTGTQLAANSMVAHITNTYNSGWQVGDIRGAHLADTVAEKITGSGELVTNGTFDTNTAGWSVNSSTLSVAEGSLVVTQMSANTFGQANQTITSLIVGKTYQFLFAIPASSPNNVIAQINGVDFGWLPPGAYSKAFIATSASALITFAHGHANPVGATIRVDNVSVKLTDTDRSVKANGLIVNGTLNKAAVAAGAGLVAYSGFSGANYLEQPYNANLDFGTGDFCVMGWATVNTTTAYLLTTEKNAASSKYALRITYEAGGVLVQPFAHSGGVSIGSPLKAVQPMGALVFIVAVRVSGVLHLYVNGLLAGSVAFSADVGDGILRMGEGRVSSFPLSSGSLALWRISATAPSADQIAHIYRTELPLFQPGAQCTIAGTSSSVTALAHDDTTELLHVGTSWGRTGFKDLLRVDSEATEVGALTSLSANQGAILQGGTSGRYYQPALRLRDELARKAEAKRALGKVPVFFEYDALTAQTAFVLPVGYTTKAVYSAEALKREGSTKTYTRSFDGYRETINFVVAPGASVWVSILCVKV